jgi:hypothetical protein
MLVPDGCSPQLLASAFVTKAFSAQIVSAKLTPPLKLWALVARPARRAGSISMP